MTQTMDLNKMGLSEMNSADITVTNGGGNRITDYIKSWLFDKFVEGAFYMGQVGGAYQQSLPSHLKK